MWEPRLQELMVDRLKRRCRCKYDFAENGRSRLKLPAVRQLSDSEYPVAMMIAPGKDVVSTNGSDTSDYNR